MAHRQNEIASWLQKLFPAMDFSTLHYIPADASSRNYLRFESEGASYIVMDTCPSQEMYNFVKIAEIMAHHKIKVPSLIEVNYQLGLILMSDLGQTTYLSALQKSSTSNINQLYLDALTTLLKIQQIPLSESISLKSMDQMYIKEKLDVAKSWYFERHLQIDFPEQLYNLLFELFVEAFEHQPQVFTHLDYHSRNLIYTESHNPGVLDFQDAMIGPAMYDLASLLQDAYITWPNDKVVSWIQSFLEIGGYHSMTTKDFYLTGLQRHIKNLGVFCRLHYRDHKPGYMQSIPTLLKYIRETCKMFPELFSLVQFIEEEGLVQPNPGE